MATIIGNDLFSTVEQLRANHYVHECEDVARLTRWHADVLSEIVRREAAAVRERSRAALRATLRQLRRSRFRGPRPRRPRPTPAWAPGTPLPDWAARRAGPCDRLAATRCQAGQLLPFVHRLTRSRP